MGSKETTNGPCALFSLLSYLNKHKEESQQNHKTNLTSFEEAFSRRHRMTRSSCSLQATSIKKPLLKTIGKKLLVTSNVP